MERLIVFQFKSIQDLRLIRSDIPFKPTDAVKQLGHFVCLDRGIVITGGDPGISLPPKLHRFVLFIALIQIDPLDGIGRQRRRYEALKPNFIRQFRGAGLAFEKHHGNG